MLRILPPALAYATAIFACGFVLGAVRVMWLAPRLGDVAAVAVELPPMLALSWWVAGRVLARWPLRPGGARLKMGAMAFALLIAFEVAMALAFGGTPGGFLRGLATPQGSLGLGGQIVFALIPWLRR